MDDFFEQSSISPSSGKESSFNGFIFLSHYFNSLIFIFEVFQIQDKVYIDIKS